MYRSGLLDIYHSKLPVICVGNITAGGTGKTPFCIMLAGELSKKGLKPAIISRGYKRKAQPGRSVLAINNWREILAGPEEAGDEPYLVARKMLGKVLVLVGSDRRQTALMAEDMGADVIIMDDGFQHRRMARDLDIVLLDGQRPLENGWLLPAGRLREPASALKRAGIVVTTRNSEGTVSETVSKLMEKFNKKASVFCCQHRPVGLKSLDCRPVKSPIKLESKSTLFIFSGIARPESFQNSIRALGHNVSGHITFGDHHSYRPSDLDKIKRAASASDAIVTTEKDAVKLPIDWDPGKPLLVLEIEAVICSGNEREKMLELIMKVVKK
jgi:tetraacyldisaccharide 4'-kinase